MSEQLPLEAGPGSKLHFVENSQTPQQGLDTVGHGHGFEQKL